MSISHTHVLSFAVLAACTLAPVAAVRAADAPEAAPSKAEDAAMKEELKYIGALVDANMPDLAEPGLVGQRQHLGGGVEAEERCA